MQLRPLCRPPDIGCGDFSFGKLAGAPTLLNTKALILDHEGSDCRSASIDIAALQEKNGAP